MAKTAVTSGAPVVETVVNPVTAIIQTFHPRPVLIWPDGFAKQAGRQYEHRDFDEISKLPCIHVHSPCFKPISSASAPYSSTPRLRLTCSERNFCIFLIGSPSTDLAS
ncbi:MAG: hypothetical protein P8M18_11955 [Woeseiaceae bacterium]|nr:hypothetical protein [Woeseiaceae bacterium]